MRPIWTAAVLLSLASFAYGHGLIVFENTTITDDVDGDVIVLNGAVVTVDNATIDGSLFVLDASSVALSSATINGGVYVGHDSAIATVPGGIDGTVIGGSVIAYRAVSVNFSDPAGTSIGGNLTVKRTGPDLLIAFTEIGGSVFLVKNETLGATVFETLIEGNLICYGNSEEPLLIDVTINGYQFCGE